MDYGRWTRRARAGHRSGAKRGQSTVEMTVLFVALVVTIVAMQPFIRRAVAGYWFRAFHASEELPYLPGRTQTIAPTTLRVRQYRHDKFIGKQYTDEQGLPVLLSRIKTVEEQATKRTREERVTVPP